MSDAEEKIKLVKDRLFKYMFTKGDEKWVDDLDNVKKALNNAYSKNIKMTPKKAYNLADQSVVWDNLHTKPEAENFRTLIKSGGYHFEIGQLVRIAKNDNFSKQSDGNFTESLYKVIKRMLRSNIPMYKIAFALNNDEVEGDFYTQELKAVNIDQSKLPKIKSIHQFRRDGTKEQIQVTFENAPNKRVWIYIRDLIVY